MELSTNITKQDYSIFLQYLYTKSMKNWKNLLIVVFIIVTIIIYAIYEERIVQFILNTDLVQKMLLSYNIALLLCLIIITYLVLIMVRMQPEENGVMFGSKRIIIKEDEIIEESEDYTSRWKISAIRRFEEGENHIYIMFDKVFGLIIPRTAFKNFEEYEQFKKMIKVPN